MFVRLADDITLAVLVYTFLFFSAILIMIVMNRNRQPRPWLDRAYMWEKCSFCLLLAWTITRLYIYSGGNPYGAFFTAIRLFVWFNLGLAETAVLWCIYLERYGLGSFTRWIKRKLHVLHKALPGSR